MKSRKNPEDMALWLIADMMKTRKRPLITFWKDYKSARKQARVAVACILDDYDQTDRWATKENDRKYWLEVMRILGYIIP